MTQRADGPRSTAPTDNQAVHGLTGAVDGSSRTGVSPVWNLCVCGCGRMVQQVTNRNGLMKEYFDDKCRERMSSRARDIGRRVIRSGVPESTVDTLLKQARSIEPGKLLVLDRGKRELRRKRQEYVDLDGMSPQERLGALCRAAEKMGVME